MSKSEMTGIYQASGRGYGFFIPDGGGEDWFVPPHRSGTAWDGDLVAAAAISSDSPQAGNRTHSGAAPLPNKASGFAGDPNQRRTCKITAVLERVNKDVVGTVHKQGRELWLEPDNKRLPSVLVLAKKGKVGNNEKAAVTMTSFGGRGEPPVGRLTETFGRAGTRQAAVDATLYRYDIWPDFPPDVQIEAERLIRGPREAAKQLSGERTSTEMSEFPALDGNEGYAGCEDDGRRDLRDELIITIDGASAKDLDDAISLTRDGQGRQVLGVHIADVSHYVTPYSALDREAFERGTSVYFADRVIPMLPKELSNGICSLHPGVDRLTLSCFMTLDEDAHVVGQEIVKSVIRSVERMTYSDCNKLLADEDADLKVRYDHVLPMLREMAALAAKLERNRRLRGSLDLNSSEAAILCDRFGHPVGVELRKPGLSEGLIEEFMLAANETVARYLHGLSKPAVYRVHEKPTGDKVERLRAMLAPFGLDVGAADHFALQKVLREVEGKPEEPAVNAVVLRSMMKARYDPENLGHFGLAAQYYCHFTSPIRRYPDLMVHRVLSALLAGELHGNAEGKLRKAVERAAVQSSQRELAAQSAEREIEKFYMAEFMADHIGEKFPAAVSGVTRYGLFVMLPFGVEGMVPVESLPGFEYDFDEYRMTLTGRGGVYTFGMPLEVVCVSADPGTGQIDFRLEGTPEAAARRKPEKKPVQPPKQKKKQSYKPPRKKKR